MIRVIKPSTYSSVWYLDPGVPPDGDGLSFESPILWQLHSSNDGTRCSFTTPSASYFYIMAKLLAGVTYTLTIGSQTGPTTYDLFADGNDGTVIQSMSAYDNSVHTFTVPATGVYIFRATEFYSSGSTEYFDIVQAPEIITGEASWKVDKTRVRPGVWDANGVPTGFSSTTLAEVAVRLFPEIPENGLWGYWPLTVDGRDVSKNRRDMDITGLPAFTKQSGMSAITVDDYVSLAEFVYGANPRSVSMWFNNTGLAKGTLFNQGQDDYGKNLGCSVNENNQIHEDIYGWSDSDSIPTAAGLHHFVMTYSSAPDMRLYIDGAEIGNHQAGTATVNTPLTIGVWKGMNATASGPFGGSISDVALYSRVLSAAEVAQIYAAGNTLNP